MSKAKPSSDKPATSSETDMNSRLDKLEALVTRMVDALPTAAAAGSGDTRAATAAGSASGSGMSQLQYGMDSSLDLGVDNYPDYYDTGSQNDEEDNTPAQTDTGDNNFEIEIPQFAAKFAAPSAVGAPLHDSIAKAVDFMMGQKMEEKALSEAAKKYTCPDNCKGLGIPKVNPAIWANLSTPTRTRDFKLQSIEKSLTKGLCAFAHTLHPDTMTEAQQDALALLCDATYAVNGLR